MTKHIPEERKSYLHPWLEGSHHKKNCGNMTNVNVKVLRKSRVSYTSDFLHICICLYLILISNFVFSMVLIWSSNIEKQSTAYH